MFQGRYGNDFFNQRLSIATIAILVLNMAIRLFWGVTVVSQVLSLVSMLLFIVVLFRMFSRNFEARARENEKYMRFHGKMKQKWADLTGKNPHRAKTAKNNPTWEERRKYKYLICPQCTQRLRVPRGKGKLRVTCTRCGNKFDVKS